jgi:predicted phosphodiesterase
MGFCKRIGFIKNVPIAFLLLVFVSACSDSSEGNSKNSPRGPYLQNPSSTTMVVRWRAKKPSSGEVSYGKSSTEFYDVVVGVSKSVSASSNEHEALLENLTPDTHYYYKIGDQDKVYSFKTPPPEGVAKPTRVWILGDSGTGGLKQKFVREAFYNFNNGDSSTDLMIMLGDLSQGEGSDDEYQREFFQVYRSTLHSTPVFATIGNHDARTKGGTPYFDMFTLPIDGKTGGVPSGTEYYYSFNYSNIHFVCLDTQISDRSPAGLMYSWLMTDLAANTQDWTVVYLHQPPYTKGSYDSDTGSTMTEVREIFTPVFEMYGVDLVFSGHSHVYERSFPIYGHQGTSDTFLESMKTDSGDGRIDGDGIYQKPFNSNTYGIIYTVAGSSGNVRPGPLNHPAHYLSLAELGSVVLDFDGDVVDVTFVSPAPEITDYYTIAKVP